ncbi:hypothetical protein Btru_059719 [Bulinus truncatus]|nr:hypothetical protein Btru_059719 [Bulinus truncatus]
MPTTRIISICPVSARILNGYKVTKDCEYFGVTNITANNGSVVVCNAILTTATVNGVFKKTFLTASSCKAIIVSQSSNGITLDLQLGVQRYPLVTSFFSFIDGKDDVAFIDMNPIYANLLNYLGTCQKPACPYNDATMNGKVDFTDCKIVSWGFSNITNMSNPKSDGMYEASVTLSPLGCSSIPKSSTKPSDLCFRTKSGLNLMCYGDTGAPVFCKAPSNGEWILLGISQIAPSCNTTSEFRVLPFPG